MFFEFENNHISKCGTPPKYLTSEWNCKVAENEYGEQILMARHNKSRHFQFHHGDCGWDKVFTIQNPPALSKQEEEIISEFWIDSY